MERPKRSSRAWRLAAAGILLAGGLLLLLRLFGAPEPAGTAVEPEAARAPAPAEEPASLAPVGEGEVDPPRSPEREALPVVDGRVDLPPLADPTETSAGAAVRGRVFHVRGGPVAGVRVTADKTEVDGEPASATTHADGRFEIVVRDAYDTLAVDDARYVNLRVPEVRRTSRKVEHPIVVTNAIRVSGRVVDPNLASVPGVRLDLVLARKVYNAVPAALDTTRQVQSWQAKSDGEGAFLFEALPAVPGGTLRVQRSGFASKSEPAPVSPTSAMVIHLRPARAREAAREVDLVEGSVFAEGRGAVGAKVQAGPHRTETDEKGFFKVPAGGIDADDALVVVHAGYAPYVDAEFGTKVQLGERWFLRLELLHRAASIAGRLVDANGEACAGWSLKLLSGTEVDPNVFPPLFAEDLAAGGEILEHMVDARDVTLGRGGFSRPTGKSPNQQRTGENGSFRIDGLVPFQSYVLRAWNPQTLQIVESDPVRAPNESYLFRVPTDVFRDRVWGTVRGLDGTPIANVRVRLTMRVHQNRRGTSFHTGQSTHTGPDGAFEFADVPRVDLLLRFTGEEVASLYREFPAYEEGANLDVRLARRCHFRFETTPGPDAPDALRLLDRFGEPLRMKIAEAGRSSSPDRVRIENGRTGVLGADENARWLVLEKDGKELRRISLRLTPGEVAVVRD